MAFQRALTNQIQALLSQGKTPEQIMYGSAGKDYLLNQTKGHYNTDSEGNQTDFALDNPNAPKIAQSPLQQLWGTSGGMDGYNMPAIPNGNDSASIQKWLSQIDATGREGLRDESSVKFDPTYGLVTDPLNRQTDTRGFRNQLGIYMPAVTQAVIGTAAGMGIGGAIGAATGAETGSAGAYAGNAAGRLATNAAMQAITNGSVDPRSLAVGALTSGVGALGQYTGLTSNLPNIPNGVIPLAGYLANTINKNNTGSNTQQPSSTNNTNNPTGNSNVNTPTDFSNWNTNVKSSATGGGGGTMGGGGGDDDPISNVLNGSNPSGTTNPTSGNNNGAGTVGGLLGSIFGPGNSSGTGLNSANIGALISAISAQQNVGQYEDLANKAAGMSDPFASQRAQYQTQLSSLMADPQAYLDKDPAFQSQLALGSEGVQRSSAAKGYMNSGNILTALQKYGTDLTAQTIPQREAQLAGLAGANFGPGQAGSNYAQIMGNAINSGNDVMSNLYAALFGKPNAGVNVTNNVNGAPGTTNPAGGVPGMPNNPNVPITMPPGGPGNYLPAGPGNPGGNPDAPNLGGIPTDGTSGPYLGGIPGVPNPGSPPPSTNPFAPPLPGVDVPDPGYDISGFGGGGGMMGGGGGPMNNYMYRR